MSAPAYQISSFWLKNVGLYTASKIAKNRNFWYKFASKGKFWGSTEKLNIDAQLQTFLYAMTP